MCTSQSISNGTNLPLFLGIQSPARPLREKSGTFSGGVSSMKKTTSTDDLQTMSITTTTTTVGSIQPQNGNIDTRSLTHHK